MYHYKTPEQKEAERIRAIYTAMLAGIVLGVVFLIGANITEKVQKSVVECYHEYGDKCYMASECKEVCTPDTYLSFAG